MFDNILLDIDGAIATLTVNRPDRRNAVNNATVEEINQALDRLERQGTLAEIHLRWYGQDLSQSQPQAAPLDDQGGQE